MDTPVLPQKAERVGDSESGSKCEQSFVATAGAGNTFMVSQEGSVAALATGLSIRVNPVFCTKVGSRLARTYTPRHGLKDLVMELVGVELDKQAQSSDWGRVDELSDAQLAYAANDARYLLPARRQLEVMLRREGRWELAQRCFACVPVMSDLDRFRFINTFEH